jgi:LuxR family transcriptional regulator, maltose regulon positive regulatory protein
VINPEQPPGTDSELSAVRDDASTAAAILLATKLRPPAVRQKRVARLGLLERLRAAGWPRLTLVDAPAGSGKTTLLADWHAARADAAAFAWVALDRGDNDPARFWTYVVEALRTAVPHIGGRTLALLRAPGAGILQVALPTLINDLGEQTQPVVLVLDDYHVISNAEIHAEVDFFLEHLPPTLHLVLSTRSDPPLPLGRLRARGELLEVRAEDLRFSAAEATTFLNDVLELGLDPGDIARLHERTEGWAAGLYLAALWLRGRGDAHQFIEVFAGDDRHIVDYLGAEVLGSQPEAVRTFLLRTSILDRLCGPLCDAVCGSQGSTGVLQQIERSNLFLIPLDAKRHWYRYHHLFGELLRHELQQTEPDLVPALHRRAHAWHRDQGLIPQAIHHALAANDVADAVELIAQHWNGLFNQGRLATVAGWLDALSPRVVLADPRLCVARAWLAMDTGRLDEVGAWIEAAETVLATGALQHGAAGLRPETAVLRAVYRFKSGDIGQASAAARRALESDSDEASFRRTVASCILGITLYWAGAGPDAHYVLEQAARLARSAGNDLAAAYALGYQAVLLAESGELTEAESRAVAALRQSDEPGFAEHFVLSMAHLARGSVHEQRGELAEAEAAVVRAAELARRGAGRIELAFGLAMLARVQRARGDQAGALEVLREARQVAHACADPGRLGRILDEAEHRPARGRARRPAAATEELTEREMAVLRLLPSGLSQREIGTALYVSQNTVKTHMRGIYGKLGASTRRQAVIRAHELGLL